MILQCKIQESDTKDFQDQNHDLASSGIPKKAGKKTPDCLKKIRQ